MKSFLTLLSLSVFWFSGHSQNWETITSDNQLSIYAAETEHNSSSDGINHQRFIFKYENHTTSPIELHFNREVKYGEANTVQEQDFVVSIPANSSIEYNDSKKYDKTFYLFKKDNQGIIEQSLKDFKIINLTIR